MKKLVSILLCFAMLFSSVAVIASAEDSENTATYSDHTYVRYDLSMTWTEAKAYCENLGGYLATVTSSGENEVINSLVQNGEKAQYWLGATDEEQEGRFKWVTGEEMTYVPAQRNFDNAFGREDYLQVYRHNWGDESYLGFWNDSSDDNHINGEESFFSLEHVGFICEFGESELEAENNLDVPVVYIIGRTGIARADGSTIIDESTRFMTDVVKDNMKLLLKSVAKNNYDEYCDVIYDAISEAYADYKLSDEGTVTNGSSNRWRWSEDSIPQFQSGIYTYKFEYDCRLDPCDIADDLHDYVEAIKRVTGFDKFNLVSCCLGSNIATAYLAEYGWDDINTNIIYASAAKGYDFVGEMFAGKFDFNAESVNYYIDENVDEADDEAFEDEYLLEFFKALIAKLENNGTLAAGTAIGKQVYNKIAKNLVPRLLKATYATCPGYWAMVNEDNYEDAKKYIFGDEAETTYATLIEKLDAYHYNVQNEVENLFVKMDEDGVKINILCKYGFQTPPFVKSSTELGDNRIDVTGQSLGATTSATGKTLSLCYLNKADKTYLSPDKQIDGSTALFPDRTWYIKNNVHNTFYDCFNEYLFKMCRSETQFTIYSDESFPQYLLFNDGSFEPLVKENMETQDYTTNWFTAKWRMLVATFKLIFSKIFGVEFDK